MALQTAAVSASHGQQGAATHNVQGPSGSGATLHKQEIAQEVAVQEKLEVVEQHPASQLAPQPSATTAAPVQGSAVQANAAASQNDAVHSNGAQAPSPQTDQPQAAVIPNTLEVVCADVQGVLTLDFKTMRCHILHKGRLHAEHKLTHTKRCLRRPQKQPCFKSGCFVNCFLYK